MQQIVVSVPGELAPDVHNAQSEVHDEMKAIIAITPLDNWLVVLIERWPRRCWINTRSVPASSK
jgi:hypothetical protein